MAARGAERFRNYGSVLEQHEKSQRIKKIIRVFGFFLVILILVMIIIMLGYWESHANIAFNFSHDILETRSVA